MSLRAALVPVLQGRGRTDAEALSATLLHGEPLYVHAARALAALPGARVLVTTTPAQAAAVRTRLGRSGIPWARVVETAPGVGATLVRALAELPAVSGRAAEHEVGVVLVHDPRCPLVPASCLHEVLERAEADPTAVHAAARPVTDTVKSVSAGSDVVGSTAGTTVSTTVGSTVSTTVGTTVDRDTLRALASPLALPVRLLRRLDDGGGLAGCVEPGDVLDLALAAGVPVRWVAAPSLARRVVSVAEVGVLECFADVRAGR